MKYIRLPIQVFLYLLEWCVSLFEKLVNFFLHLIWKTEYVRKGDCQLTGQCCQAIGIELPKSWFHKPWLVRLVNRWHFLRYNFEYHEVQNDMLVYSCHYLRSDNKCGIQKFKPKICRDFPRTPLFGITKVHKGCGFYFEKRFGKDFGKTLKQVQKPSK